MPYKPDFPVQREPSNGKDFAYLNYDVTEQEQLDLPGKSQ